LGGYTDEWPEESFPMDSPGSITRWGAELRSPDAGVRDEAARRIWECYADRLVALVRHNLDARIRRREDVADILQSMYKSFCLRRPAAEVLLGRDEVWRLLVHITLCKVKNSTRRHRAERRDVRREEAIGGAGRAAEFPDWLLEEMEQEGPDASAAAALEEELQEWLALLPESLRRIVLWRLEGYTNREIGDMIQLTERSVELKLQIIRARLRGRLEALDMLGRG
jgi:DNA-directed RNA polymerase specialized sigma24 family protein